VGVLQVSILLPNVLGQVLREQRLGALREGGEASQVSVSLQLVAANYVSSMASLNHVIHLLSGLNLLLRRLLLLLLHRLLLRLRVVELRLLGLGLAFGRA
jgi:hypothetical protein